MTPLRGNGGVCPRSFDTARCWETHASAHFIPFFGTAEDLVSDARLGDYMRHRLTKVKGHKHVATTKEYLHSNLEEAQAVLFRTSYLTNPADAASTSAELIAQAAEMIGCGREDSGVTGLWQSGADASPGSGQIPDAIRRPLQGAEYTVGRVLVDPPDVFARRWVRKRGLEPPRVLPH